MKIFGKSLSEYISFQKGILFLILIVGFGRLALSLAGVPNSIGKWLSLTAVMAIGIVYYGVKVHASGFGGYKHLLPLLYIQNVLAESIVILGIAIAIFTNKDNIFSAPEYRPSPNTDGKTWGHAAGHLIFGMLILPLVFWAIASLLMFVAKKMSPGGRSAAAGA